MRVNKVDYAASFEANTTAMKRISCALRDGETAVIDFSLNNEDKISRLSGVILNKNSRVVAGKGMTNANGLNHTDVIPFFENLQNRAEMGVNFFKEFMSAMLK